MTIFIFYFFVHYQKRFNLIFTLFIFTISLQSLISFAQFLRQSSLGLPLEISQVASAYYANIDEVSNIFRVSGTFHYHNQLALIILLLIVFISVRALEVKKTLYLLSIIFGFITILLSQSRSVWLAALIFIYFLFLDYKKELSKIVTLIGARKIILLILVIVVGLSYVLIPRLILSLNLFYEGAGFSFRTKIFSEALESISINPLVGWGIGTNEYVLVSLFPNGVVSAFPTAVHNAYLQLTLEVGLLGTLFFLLPFLLILREFYVNKSNLSSNKKTNHYKFVYKSGLVICSLYYFFQPHVGILEFSYLGVLVGFGLIGVYLGGNYEKN